MRVALSCYILLLPTTAHAVSVTGHGSIEIVSPATIRQPQPGSFFLENPENIVVHIRTEQAEYLTTSSKQSTAGSTRLMVDYE